MSPLQGHSFNVIIPFLHIVRNVQRKADEMKAVSLQSAIDTCEKLEIKLTDFAKTHRNEIRDGACISSVSCFLSTRAVQLIFLHIMYDDSFVCVCTH